MNKHCYRIIFNRLLQRFVVVSEITTKIGKAPQSGNRVFTNLSRMLIHWRLTPLMMGLYSLLGVLAVSSFSASAVADELQIRADSQAPKSQQPIVLQTANGLPQVNIQTPNDKGLSHNKYQQFDVNTRGAILNNSRKNVKTEQGGWVQANPYLVGGEAKVILNEVNASKPSQLKGYIEVAGSKAEVIIANPNGIHCEGCGFINARRSTMTTGQVQLENGQVKGYRVEQGEITVSGRGLDSHRQDYTEIIAKEVNVNAGIWANQLTVTTGQNQVPAQSTKSASSLQVIRGSEVTASQGYAVDVAELGGMYANQIHLIGTESGLGVRNAGHIGAAAGDVVIDSQGQIINSGYIGAKQNVNIVTRDTIENQANANMLAQQGNITLHTPKAVRQAGTVSAKQSTTIQARTLQQPTSGEIQSGAVALTLEDTLDNRGLINSYADDNSSITHIQAKHIDNIGTGRIYGDHIALQADSLLNQDERTEDTHAAVIAARKRLDIGVMNVTNRTTQYEANKKGGASIYSGGDIVFGRTLDKDNHATGQGERLDNDSSIIEAEKNISLNINNINNTNRHFTTKAEVISTDNLTYHYLRPENSEQLINWNLLKWIDFSKAGRVAPHNYSMPTTLPENNVFDGHLLPYPNTQLCTTNNSGGDCPINPASIYSADSPIWTYFNIEAPTTAPTGVSSDDWNNKIAEKYLKLGKAIDQHNSKLNKTNIYTNFDDIVVEERQVIQDVINTSKPGKILAKGNITFQGENFINDKSIIIAAHLPDQTHAQNIDATGIKINIDKGIQRRSYIQWNGGLDRYYTRHWSDNKPYQKEVREDMDIPVAQYVEHTNYQQIVKDLAQRPITTTNKLPIVSDQPSENNNSIPENTLYPSNPKIEDNLLFTDKETWLNSDYMYTALRNFYIQRNINNNLSIANLNNEAVTIDIEEIQIEETEENENADEDNTLITKLSTITKGNKATLRDGKNATLNGAVIKGSKISTAIANMILHETQQNESSSENKKP
ncbi:filamentous hemagglutinin N-terminal domain-containing protein [Gallibacterium trehalosifermentans]|uniref:Filamentous hemagglutinin N-terminal domain-containing protein n=1 Tax=Gallibacterium trehalosifermentans TaxID=516935 RepID=A0ABV6H196_9PAST